MQTTQRAETEKEKWGVWLRMGNVATPVAGARVNPNRLDVLFERTVKPEIENRYGVCYLVKTSTYTDPAGRYYRVKYTTKMTSDNYEIRAYVYIARLRDAEEVIWAPSTEY